MKSALYRTGVFIGKTHWLAIFYFLGASTLAIYLAQWDHDNTGADFFFLEVTMLLVTVILYVAFTLAYFLGSLLRGAILNWKARKV